MGDMRGEAQALSIHDSGARSTTRMPGDVMGSTQDVNCIIGFLFGVTSTDEDSDSAASDEEKDLNDEIFSSETLALLMQ